MDDLPQTRQSLIIRLKQNGNDAWTEVLGVYERAILRFCLARGLQEADARDVTQEVFSALHSRMHQWEAKSDRGSFRGWLFRVARNIVVDRTRERARAPTNAEEQTLAGLPQQADVEASAFQFEYRRSIFHWAAEQVRPEVNDHTWQCFWKTAVQNQAANEVADLLGVSVGNVYTAKCRMVSRIRKKITELSGISFDVSLDESPFSVFLNSETDQPTSES